MSGINYFCLGDFCSEDHDIILTSSPPEVFAERDVEVVSVPGRSGDLICDNGRYKNITIQYECAIIPSDWETLREAAIHAVSVLKPSAGYQRLTTTYDPNHFRMARISSSVSVESIVEQAGTFKLSLDCKPQRYLTSGEFALSLDSPAVLVNNTGFPALPLIKIYGSGEGTLIVGSVTVQINELEDFLYLDCDLQDAYKQVEGDAVVNKNNSISASVFPVLEQGDSLVSWAGGIERVEITPRWWTL